MLRTRVFGLACAVAVFVCLTAAAVSAQPLDKRTLFTFTGPVTLPGVTLPAGPYLFRLADPNTSSKVVQVLNADGTKPYGMFFTLSAERFEPASSPEVRFMETVSGTPPAIETWWYPGERTGYEFIYPKEQARRLATGARQPVLTTHAQTTTTEQTNTTELSRVASGGQETQVNATAAPTAATPTGNKQEGQIASSSLSISTPPIPAVGGAPAVSQTASTQTASRQTNSARSARTRLPRTASHLPVVAMIGALALLSAGSVRYWRTRVRSHREIGKLGRVDVAPAVERGRYQRWKSLSHWASRSCELKNGRARHVERKETGNKHSGCVVAGHVTDRRGAIWHSEG